MKNFFCCCLYTFKHIINLYSGINNLNLLKMWILKKCKWRFNAIYKILISRVLCIKLCGLKLFYCTEIVYSFECVKFYSSKNYILLSQVIHLLLLFFKQEKNCVIHHTDIVIILLMTSCWTDFSQWISYRRY